MIDDGLVGYLFDCYW